LNHFVTCSNVVLLVDYCDHQSETVEELGMAIATVHLFSSFLLALIVSVCFSFLAQFEHAVPSCCKRNIIVIFAGFQFRFLCSCATQSGLQTAEVA